MGDLIEVDIRGEDYVTDAQTWDRACRHIGLLLWFAAERGLAAEEHKASKVRKRPTKYFVAQCDTKLLTEDLASEGAAFVVEVHAAYMVEVLNYAKARKLGVYDIAESAATAKHFFGWLDRALKEFRVRQQQLHAKRERALDRAYAGWARYTKAMARDKAGDKSRR